MCVLKLSLLLLLCTHDVMGDNCSSANSCSECMLIDVVGRSCYWCAGLVTDKSLSGCLRFRTNKIANLLCPSNWVHIRDMCPADEGVNNLDLLKLSQMSQLSQPNNKLLGRQRPDIKLITTNNNIEETLGELKATDLHDLLHKLLILKLLRKMRNENTVLTKEEQALLYKSTHDGKMQESLPKTTTTTTTTTTVAAPASKQELSEFIQLLKEEAGRRLGTSVVERIQSESSGGKLKNELENVYQQLISKQKKGSGDREDAGLLKSSVVTTESPTVTISTTVKTLKGQNHVEHGVVQYEESTDDTLETMETPRKHKKDDSTQKQTVVVETLKTTAVATTKSVKLLDAGPSYCKLFEENGLCNSDHNCTWCNTLDSCIHRRKEDYRMCVSRAELMVDDEYGLDRCFKSKGCKDCVDDDKCYWCEVSQRCHTYPFFGYVPNSCGGDWYVKQCDVQLAVIIVVLPLILILLGMVTFYFCLKYCHYRRKVLRVPLFEKPGIFDYRKDKKVYFVNPEDEDSADELTKERMRKKYRLPVEKAPLIDPNT